MDHIKQLLEGLFGAGVTYNIWNDARLYVNLKNNTSFSYDLTQNFKISSPQLLKSSDFLIAKRLIPQLKRLIQKEKDGDL